jgi:CubicO group peptidase (beta-lactamase class C family)
MQRIYRIFLLIVIVAFGVVPLFASEGETSCCDFGSYYWSVSGTLPDAGDNSNEWVFSTPEAEGMDGAALAQGIAELRTLASIHSLLILRHGRIVSETYFNGQNATRSYEIASVSKSILSALVGIAIDRGHIESIHQRLSDLLLKPFANAGVTKQRITVRDLLTMQAGLFWEPTAPLDMISWQHVVEDVIAQPLTYGEGMPFKYSTGLAHLASAVLSEVTGQTACEFACETLFSPLGIAPEYWGQDADGIYTGGWFMYFTPREMARFGQLYLQGGEWNGTQIIPSSWVSSSLAQQVRFDPFSGYGYWWWISSHWEAATNITYEIQSARGGGGQMIYLVPELGLVMVTTSDHAYQGTNVRFDSEGFLQRVVIPSILDTP